MGKTNRNNSDRRFSMPTKNESRRSNKNPFAGLRVIKDVTRFINTGVDVSDGSDFDDDDDDYC